MTIRLTDKAARHAKKYLGKEEETSFLRVGITTNGIKILTDKLSYQYLEGLLIDFKKDGINEGFSFQNPNADATCGCGESFSIDSDNA